jgi:hypothetical protein
MVPTLIVSHKPLDEPVGLPKAAFTGNETVWCRSGNRIVARSGLTPQRKIQVLDTLEGECDRTQGPSLQSGVGGAPPTFLLFYLPSVSSIALPSLLPVTLPPRVLID